MRDIEYLLLDPTQEKHTRRIRTAEYDWHGFTVRLHLVPLPWVHTNGHGFLRERYGRASVARLQDYVQQRRQEGMALWIAPELEPYLPFAPPPFPEPGLAAWLLSCQPFRQILILRRQKGSDQERDWWEEAFLETCYEQLNGLYLLGEDRPTAAEEALFNRFYEDSGLVVVPTDRIPQVDGRKTVLVDLDRKDIVDCRQLPEGCLYLDLTSDRKKQRRLTIKRADISYISPRNYLDTALKARYNAI